MAQPTCELEGVVAVLVGSFNPAILYPGWLASHDLISKAEAEAAEVKIIVPELSSWSADWLRLQVTRDRMIIETADASFGPAVRDLVVGIFQVLEHTPVKMLGINRRMHFKIGSVAEWQLIAEFLAPHTPWKDIVHAPHATSLTVQGMREGCEANRIDIKVERSVKVDPGVYIRTNEHYESDDDNGLNELMGFVQSNWEVSQRWARSSAEKLVERAHEFARKRMG